MTFKSQIKVTELSYDQLMVIKGKIMPNKAK